MTKDEFRQKWYKRSSEKEKEQFLTLLDDYSERTQFCKNFEEFPYVSFSIEEGYWVGCKSILTLKNRFSFFNLTQGSLECSLNNLQI